MADTVSKDRRSEIMSHIRCKNTSIELLVRKQLYAQGYRYRINYKGLPGKPDIVFIKKKIAIFIHGCFWHGHDIGCRYSHIAKTQTEYWEAKIAQTKKRDNEHQESLENCGWIVLTVWECDIRKDFDNTIMRISDVIKKSK